MRIVSLNPEVKQRCEVKSGRHNPYIKGIFTLLSSLVSNTEVVLESVALCTFETVVRTISITTITGLGNIIISIISIILNILPYHN